MVTLPSSVRIFVATQPVDMRKGFDGLSAATRTIIRKDPMSGHLFVFINRRGDRVKILWWDRTGFLILYKKLARGVFRIPRPSGLGQMQVEVDSGELGLMLEGLDLSGAWKGKRWRRLPQEAEQWHAAS